MLLREVADLEAMAGFECAVLGLLGACQQTQQRGLACAVEPEHHHPASAVDGEVHTGEDLQRSVHLRQARRHQRRLAAGCRLGEPDLRGPVGNPLFIEVVEHAFGALEHVLGRNGFGCLGTHLGRLHAQRAGLLLSVCTFTLAALFVGRPRVEVLLPSHVVDVGLAAYRVEEPHPVHHVGEQFHIVTDHDESTVVVL